MQEFKNPTQLGRTAIIVLWGNLTLDLSTSASTAFQAFATAGSEELLFFDALLAIAAFLWLIGTFIVVGMWIYRASANAHAISSEMTISPGWAVGWYFVPVMNLVRPFQAMKETWLASHYRGNWHGEPTPALLVAWWTLWLTTNFLGWISLRLTMSSSLGEINQAAATVALVASLLNVALCLILITMIRRITEAQRYARVDETFA